MPRNNFIIVCIVLCLGCKSDENNSFQEFQKKETFSVQDGISVAKIQEGLALEGLKLFNEDTSRFATDTINLGRAGELIQRIDELQDLKISKLKTLEMVI